MSVADIMQLLQIDLGFVTLDELRQKQLKQLVDAAVGFIAREGLQLAAPFTVEEAQLVEMYAAYLFRKRDTGEAMPRMLRWALNNAILAQAGSGGGSDTAE